MKTTRRGVLGAAWQPLRGEPTTPKRVPVDELVNSLEFGEQAERVLPPDVFATIAGSDRSAFDRLTFRPRMNVPTLDMNLAVRLFGHEHFTPLLVGPVAEQGRYHAEGELATITGAAEAKTVTIVSHRSSLPLERLGEAAASKSVPLWCAVRADADAAVAGASAVAAGAGVVVATVGPLPNLGPDLRRPARWEEVEALRHRVDVPVIVKGVMTPADAERARELGCDGVIVSNYGGLLGGGQTTSAPIDALIAVSKAVGPDFPVLVDGSFRRATDILSALILGARGILLARPVMWALAAYGAEGVRTLLRMLQYDLARCFAMLGASNLDALTPRHIKIHRR